MGKETKDKILDVAESQFAHQGFENTSLRSITAAAEVNLASVNYHFGSKKSLIQAVLERYLCVLMPAVNQKLISLAQSHQETNVELVFECIAEPLLSLNKIHPDGTSTFLRLISRGYIESQGHLRRFISARYGEVLQFFLHSINKALPHISPVEVFWRLHFALGTTVFATSSGDALMDIAQADYHESNDIGRTISRIIRFVSYGLSAPEEDIPSGL